MLLWIGLGLLAAAVVPYVIFFIGIHIGKKPEKPPALSEYPPISIVISAYNEEAVIRKRVENILVSSYPADRYEVIFVDDCSSDNTRALALDAFEKAGIDGRGRLFRARSSRTPHRPARQR